MSPAGICSAAAAHSAVMPLHFFVTATGLIDDHFRQFGRRAMLTLIPVGASTAHSRPSHISWRFDHPKTRARYAGEYKRVAGTSTATGSDCQRRTPQPVLIGTSSLRRTNSFT